MSKKEDLEKMGFSPFAWGDFWKTGHTARQAKKIGFGRRVDGGYKRGKKSPKWETTAGPRGGTWIRYLRDA
jgi:hypothetical protein